jgi:hypothetical protein
MSFPWVTRNPGQLTTAAVAMGTLALLFSWRVLNPSRHAGFAGSPLLMGFEVVKTIALFLILSRVYMLNSKEDDPSVRGKYVYVFGAAAGLSVIIDALIMISKRYS